MIFFIFFLFIQCKNLYKREPYSSSLQSKNYGILPSRFCSKISWKQRCHVTVKCKMISRNFFNWQKIFVFSTLLCSCFKIIAFIRENTPHSTFSSFSVISLKKIMIFIKQCHSLLTLVSQEPIPDQYLDNRSTRMGNWWQTSTSSVLDPLQTITSFEADVFAWTIFEDLDNHERNFG